GDIDEVGIFGRALTAQEIVTAYNSGSAGMCKSAPHFDASASGMHWTTHGFQISLEGLTGQGRVVIYKSTNLESWYPIYTNVPAVGPLQFLDTAATNSLPSFYRAAEQ